MGSGERRENGDERFWLGLYALHAEPLANTLFSLFSFFTSKMNIGSSSREGNMSVSSSRRRHGDNSTTTYSDDRSLAENSSFTAETKFKP